MKLSALLLGLLTILAYSSCKQDELDTTTYPNVADMLSLPTGKYITYRLDSTVFTNTGITIETHSYLVKHTVQDMTTAADGSQVYTIQRLINDVNGTGAWLANGTYRLTIFPNRLETVDNNLRVINLTAPLRLNNSWLGNQYLIGPGPNSNSSPYSDLYDMEADNDMNKWNFVYTSAGDTAIQNTTYHNVWTVTQANTASNIPPATGTSYGYKNTGIEKYAKGVGLIYKKLEVYEYQGPYSGNPQGTYTGFGITMWIVDHN